MTEHQKYIWQCGYNEEGRMIVEDHDKYESILADNLHYLRRNLQLTELFWTRIKDSGVLQENAIADIKSLKTQKVQVKALWDKLLKAEVYQLHGFVWALVNSNQYRVAEELKFPLSEYLDADLFLRASVFRCPVCSEPFCETVYLLPSCGHHVCRPCIKGAQFVSKADKKEEIHCPVPECSVPSHASPSGEAIGLPENQAHVGLSESLGKALASSSDKKKKSNGKFQGHLKVLSEKKLKYLQKFPDDLFKALTRKIVKEKTWIETERQKFVDSLEDWSKENRDRLDNFNSQILQNYHWTKLQEQAISQLSEVLHINPGLSKDMDVVQKFIEDIPSPLSPEAETFRNELSTDASIISLYTPSPYIPRNTIELEDDGTEVTVSYTMKDISEIEDYQDSPKFIFCNLMWHVNIKRALQDEDSSMEYYLYGTSVSKESCSVVAELKLLNWNADGEIIKKRFGVPKQYPGSWGYEFITWKKLTDPANGYVQDDAIRLQVHIEAVKHEKMEV